MLKKSFILVLLIGLITGFTPQLQAQEDDNEMNIAGPGADFIIAGGIYFGGKGPAGYYSGKPENENNLNYIYGNKYLWKDQITRLIADNNNFVSPNDSLWISEYPEDMHYKPAMSITLGVSYRFNKHWRMTLYYSFARLVAKPPAILAWSTRAHSSACRATRPTTTCCMSSWARRTARFSTSRALTPSTSTRW